MRWQRFDSRPNRGSKRDYAPGVWADTQFNRWLARTPVRVLVVLVAPPIAFLGIGVAFLVDHALEPGVICIFAALVGVARAVRGAPAALRAARHGDRGPDPD